MLLPKSVMSCGYVIGRRFFVTLLCFSLSLPSITLANETPNESLTPEPTPEQIYTAARSASEQAIQSISDILADPHTSETVKADILGNAPLDNESVRRLVVLLGQKSQLGGQQPYRSLPFNLNHVVESFRSNPASMGFAGSIEFVVLLFTLYDFHAGLNSLPVNFDTYKISPFLRFISGNESFAITSFEGAALATLAVFFAHNLRTAFFESSYKKAWSKELGHAQRAASQIKTLVNNQSSESGDVGNKGLMDFTDFGNRLSDEIHAVDQAQVIPLENGNKLKKAWSKVVQIFRIESQKNILLKATVAHLQRLPVEQKFAFLSRIQGTDTAEKLVWEMDPENWRDFEVKMQNDIKEFRSRFPHVTTTQLASSLIERRISRQRQLRQSNEPPVRLTKLLAVSAITSTVFGYFASWMGKYTQIADGTFNPSTAHSALDKATASLVQMIAPLTPSTIDGITVAAGASTLVLFAAIINFFTVKRAMDLVGIRRANRSFGIPKKNLFDSVLESILNSPVPVMDANEVVLEPSSRDYDNLWSKIENKYSNVFGYSSNQRRPTLRAARPVSVILSTCSRFLSKASTIQEVETE